MVVIYAIFFCFLIMIRVDVLCLDQDIYVVPVARVVAGSQIRVHFSLLLHNCLVKTNEEKSLYKMTENASRFLRKLLLMRISTNYSLYTLLRISKF